MAKNWKKSALVTAGLLALSGPLAHAQPVANTAAAGHVLAEQFCADCHVVAPNGRPGWTDAPAFDAIANRPDTTEAKLSAFIQIPHAHMLNTGRPKNESEGIATYILSLRKN
jgi:mono/diheme cytochrome c family protein